ILIELADRVGCLYGEGGLNQAASRSLKDEYKLALDEKYTIREIVDCILKSAYGPDKGLTYFKNYGFITQERTAAEVYNYSHFPGNATRHSIFNMVLKHVGEELLANLEAAGIKHPDWDEEEIR